MSKEPFIKKFTQEGCYFIYDVNTNQILEVEKEVYDQINLYREGSVNQRMQSQTFKEIDKARNDYDVFSNFRPQRVLMGMRTGEQIKEFHNSRFQQLLLELTTGCNLACSYCSTSGKYAPAESALNKMSKELCFQAVDLFYKNSRNSDDPCISYYGGEPMLCFDLIKETVAYVKSKEDSAKYSFNMTTNLNLLTPEMADFFISHDFLLNVSLDGPKHVNDRYRLSNDGKGSFDAITRNLELLQALNPDYYAQKVAISCVFAPPFDHMDDVFEFFSQNTLFKDLRIGGKFNASPVNVRDTTFIEDFGLQTDEKNNALINEAFTHRLKEAILDGDLSRLTIEGRRARSLLSNLARRSVKQLYSDMLPMGACHIGQKRLFVKTNGDFYVCERSGDDYKIGNINSGIDYEEIARQYRKLEEVLEMCKDCWAISHCERCWVALGNLDDFHGEVKERFCSSSKKIILEAFKIYAQLFKQDPECLKVFSPVP